MSSLWDKIAKFSIWRIPNYFMEPSGAFLGQRVDAVERLNKFRSWAAVAIVVGTGTYYGGLSHLGTASKGKNGVNYFNIGNNNPEGSWFLGLLITVVVGMFILPLASLCLLWWTRHGARRAVLVQLRWPYIAIAGWFAIFAAASPFIALTSFLHGSTRHMEFGIKALVWLVVAFALILELVWIMKALYLSATGLFRAQDGHPLLPLIVAPILAAITALMMGTVGSNGLVGVPGFAGFGLAWGGTITITIVSLRSAQILKRLYPADFPFRDGPLRH